MRCSFCGKPKEEVGQLVAGNRQSIMVNIMPIDGIVGGDLTISIEAAICNECLIACAQVMVAEKK